MSPVVSPGQIEKLVDMGFERSNVREALERCNGSIDHAIVRLLDQDAHAQPSTPGPGSLAYPSQYVFRPELNLRSGFLIALHRIICIES